MEDVAIGSDIINHAVEDILGESPFMGAEAAREKAVSLRTGAIDPNPLLVRDYDESVFDDDPEV